MTIRELKNFLNSVDEKYLDEKIWFCCEDYEGFGTIYDETDPLLIIDDWGQFSFVLLDTEAKEYFHKDPILWNDKDIDID